MQILPHSTPLCLGPAGWEQDPPHGAGVGFTVGVPSGPQGLHAARTPAEMKAPLGAIPEAGPRSAPGMPEPRRRPASAARSASAPLCGRGFVGPPPALGRTGLHGSCVCSDLRTWHSWSLHSVRTAGRRASERPWAERRRGARAGGEGRGPQPESSCQKLPLTAPRSPPPSAGYHPHRLGRHLPGTGTPR